MNELFEIGYELVEYAEVIEGKSRDKIQDLRSRNQEPRSKIQEANK
jgi:hypothetical protein